MTKSVVSVQGLGKKYKLGETLSHDMLRDHIVHGVRSLWGKICKSNDSKEEQGDRVYRSEKSDSEFWALKDVSLEVYQGEVLGIIGRNGAGKSTLLKILSCITDPTEGEIRIQGHVSSLLEVGTGFHPELSGRENIYLNGAIMGMTKREISAKFDDIVAFAGIEKFIDTPVKRYSSGMYVRLAFAVAAHLDPEILLVDEVLAVGDMAFQKKCLGKMDDVVKGGRTIIFISHNMSAISQLTKRCLILENGRIAFDGPTEEAIQRYSEVPAERFSRGRIPIEELPCEKRVQTDPRARFLELGFSSTREREIKSGAVSQTGGSL